MAKRRVLVSERLPAVRASECVRVSVELPKGLYAKAQEVAHTYGLSLSAWLRSLAYEHVGYEARLKPAEWRAAASGKHDDGHDTPAQRIGYQCLGQSVAIDAPDAVAGPKQE